jgi:hypothetical protein
MFGGLGSSLAARELRGQRQHGIRSVEHIDMGDDANTKLSYKHREKEGDKKSKKRRKHDDDGRKHKHRRKGSDSKLQIVDDDVNEDNMWVEKNIDMDGERVSSTPDVLLLLLHAARYSQPPFPLERV